MSKLLSQLLISLAEAAVLIGIAPKTARNWLAQGRFPIPTVRVGGKRLVRVSDVEEYVAGLVPQPTTDALCTTLRTTKSAGNCKGDQPQQKRGRGRPPNSEAFPKAMSGGGQ